MDRLFRIVRRRAPLLVLALALLALSAPAGAHARLVLAQHMPDTFASAEERAAAAAAEEARRLEQAARDASSLEECAALPKSVRHDCYPRVMEALVVAGPQQAFVDITAHARTSRWFARSCHMMMHPLGRDHHDLVTIDIIDYAGKDCVAGFLHGYLEEHLADVGATDAKYVHALCNANAQPLQRADCQHGIGHALTRNSGNDLPLALRRCRQLGDANFLLNCAGGAFMENRFAGTGRDEATATRYYDADDPGLPCRHVPADLVATCQAWAVRDVGAGERMQYCAALPREHADRCATGAGVVADARGEAPCAGMAPCWFGYGYAQAGRTRDDVAALVAACAAAPTLAGRSSCARGSGFRMGMAHEQGDRRAARSACADFPSELSKACRRGFTDRSRAVDFN